MVATSTFRIGIIGAGGIAGAHVASAGDTGGAVEVVAVADPVEASREKITSQTGAAGFQDASALIDKAKDLGLGGVVVCTPPNARLDIVERALKAGLPVLCEKPLAHTLADAKKIADLARAHKDTPAYVAYCHRFAPAVTEIARQIEDGRLGTVTRFENVFACDLPGHKDKWFSDQALAGGGAFIDMGSHSVDLLAFLLGRGEIVGAVVDRAWPGRAETSATVLLRVTKPVRPNIREGVAAVIESGWAETSRFTLTVVGTKGLLHYDYEKPTELVFKDLLGQAEVSPVETHGVRFRLQLEAFARAATGGEPGCLATFADGVHAAEVVDGAGGSSNLL